MYVCRSLRYQDVEGASVIGAEKASFDIMRVVCVLFSKCKFLRCLRLDSHPVKTVAQHLKSTPLTHAHCNLPGHRFKLIVN